MQKRPQLDDSFQVKGQWWLPDAPDDKVQGILTYSPSEIELTLNGGFGKSSLTDVGVVRSDFERIGTIYGLADGKRFTLQNVIVEGQKIHSHGGLTETTCTAHFLFTGCHSTNDWKFRAVAIGCHHLDSFLDFRSIDIRHEVVEGKLRGITAECKGAETKSIRIDSVGVELEFRSHPNCHQDQTSAIVRIENYVLIRFDDSQSFDTCLKMSWRFCQLLTLLTDQFVKPEWMELVSESQEENPCVLWAAIRQRETDSRPAHILIRLSDCADFQGIMDRWFSASDVLMNSVYLFLAARTKEDLGSHRLEPRFLMVSQAFEAFSRATTESTYMSQIDYDEQVGQVLKGAIPKIVDQDHRNSLKNRIRYGNDFSLRKRLSNALKELPSSLCVHVFNDAGSFANGIVDTRNFLTHYGDDLREKALDGGSLLWATDKLVMLVRILLLRHLGVAENQLLNALDSHNSYMQYPRLWSKYEECRSGK